MEYIIGFWVFAGILGYFFGGGGAGSPGRGRNEDDMIALDRSRDPGSTGPPSH
jgi:hypothetical protein